MIDILQTQLLEQAVRWVELSQHPRADAMTRDVAMEMLRSCVEMLAETIDMRLVPCGDDDE